MQKGQPHHQRQHQHLPPPIGAAIRSAVKREVRQNRQRDATHLSQRPTRPISASFREHRQLARRQPDQHPHQSRRDRPVSRPAAQRRFRRPRGQPSINEQQPHERSRHQNAECNSQLEHGPSRLGLFWTNPRCHACPPRSAGRAGDASNTAPKRRSRCPYARSASYKSGGRKSGHSTGVT